MFGTRLSIHVGAMFGMPSAPHLAMSTSPSGTTLTREASPKSARSPGMEPFPKTTPKRVESSCRVSSRASSTASCAAATASCVVRTMTFRRLRSFLSR